MIRDSHLVVIDGTNASGKTTFLHALCARLRRRGAHVGLLPEPARQSPLIDDVVLRQREAFDLIVEIDLFSRHISNACRASRQFSILLADRSPINVITYCDVLNVARTTCERQILTDMKSLARSWQAKADLTILCRDQYVQDRGGDMMRQKVLHIQETLDRELVCAYSDCGTIVEMPIGLELEKKVSFAMQHLNKRGIA